MLSESRTNVPEAKGELQTQEVQKFPIWEVFTKKKESAVHLHAGSLSAPDSDLAQCFAREHYGQDQPCVNMWVTKRDFLTADSGENELYELFVQWGAGLRYEHVGEVEACNGVEARDKCKELFCADKKCFTIWSCPNSGITKIDGSTDMIWRETTDQAYRLASGYSKVVRKKWEALRASKAVDDYQSEDLKDTY